MVPGLAPKRRVDEPGTARPKACRPLWAERLAFPPPGPQASDRGATSSSGAGRSRASTAIRHVSRSELAAGAAPPSDRQSATPAGGPMVSKGLSEVIACRRAGVLSQKGSR